MIRSDEGAFTRARFIDGGIRASPKQTLSQLRGVSSGTMVMSSCLLVPDFHISPLSLPSNETADPPSIFGPSREL